MQFEVAHLATGPPRHGLGGTQLIGHGIRNLGMRQRQLAPPESFKVSKPRMRPDPYAVGDRKAHGFVHHVRVARVKPASDIGRGYDIQQRRVVAHAPIAKAFAHVRIKIDSSCHVYAFQGRRRCASVFHM